MRSLLILACIVCGATTSFAQTAKFLKGLDGDLVPNTYLSSEPTEWQVFLSDSRLDEKLDLENLDEELLSAAVFHTMNKLRKRYRREEMQFSAKLDITAQNYLNFYSSYAFQLTDKNTLKLNKAAEFAARQLGFRPRLIDVVVNKQEMVNHNGRPFFYDRHDEETDLHLFYGRKEDLKDSSYVPNPIPAHTYRSLAEQLVLENLKYPNGQYLRSRAYSFMSCRVELDKRTLYKNTLPKANVIFVFGGYRTQDYKARKKEAQATANE
jgi:hypothetical protein